MAMKSTAKRNKSYGPFEVIGELKGDGRSFLALPFHEVAGCQVLISVADNYAKLAGGAAIGSGIPIVEVTIWGTIQSYETLLRRQQVRMLSGPLSIAFGYEQGWDTLIFRGRNTCGGSFVNLSGPTPTQANGGSLATSVYVKPRTGFAAPPTGMHSSQFGQPG